LLVGVQKWGFWQLKKSPKFDTILKKNKACQILSNIKKICPKNPLLNIPAKIKKVCFETQKQKLFYFYWRCGEKFMIAVMVAVYHLKTGEKIPARHFRTKPRHPAPI